MTVTKKPSISIITICYNAVEHLEATIQSVLGQDIAGLEYIIIDGGSTDGTQAIMERYASQLSYTVSEPDRGISDAFNKGIAQAKGDLVGLLNAADYYTSGALDAVQSQYKGADIVYSDMETIVDAKSDGTFRPDHHLLREDMTLCHPATLIRRDAYVRWGIYSTDYKLAMDYELLLRFFLANASFQKLNLTMTCMPMDGVSNVHWKAALAEVHKAQEEQMGKSLSQTTKAFLRTQKRAVAYGLESAGLGMLVASVRGRISRVKKDSE